MFIGRNKFIGHARVCDGSFVCRGYFFVQDLLNWSDPTGFHVLKCLFMCKDEFTFGFVLGWFDPDGVAVHVVKDHLVPVALTG